jgi:hypothetical protein
MPSATLNYQLDSAEFLGASELYGATCSAKAFLNENRVFPLGSER